MKVRFIDGSHDPKKEYEVLEEYPRHYRTELGCHKKGRVEIVEEPKTYSIQDILLGDFKDGDEFEDSKGFRYAIECKCDNMFMIYKGFDKELHASTALLKERFILVKQDKEVNIDEALKEYRYYQKTIYCLWSGSKYTYQFNRDGLINIENRLPISATEILDGKWFVKCN